MLRSTTEREASDALAARSSLRWQWLLAGCALQVLSISLIATCSHGLMTSNQRCLITLQSRA